MSEYSTTDPRDPTYWPTRAKKLQLPDPDTGRCLSCLEAALKRAEERNAEYRKVLEEISRVAHGKGLVLARNALSTERSGDE